MGPYITPTSLSQQQSTPNRSINVAAQSPKKGVVAEIMFVNTYYVLSAVTGNLYTESLTAGLGLLSHFTKLENDSQTVRYHD